MKCKYCHLSGPHYCQAKERPVTPENDGDFFLSAIIGATTDSALLGGLIGGDMLGGIVGDLFDGDLFD